MAEIKSAIELAMERTKSLVMDEEEKRDFAAKDVENRVRTLLRRFREGLADLLETKESFWGIPGDDGAKRAILVDVLTTEFDILDKDKGLIDLLDNVCGLPEAVRSELKAIRNRYQEEIDRRSMIVRERVREDLKRQGLSGPALEPNLDGWEAWEQEAQDTKRAFERRVADWRKLVEKSCGRTGSS